MEKVALRCLATLILSGSPGFAATAPALSGSIAGYVRDAAGVPQMGATVLLFNRSDRVVQQALTNDRGIFGFDALSPDTYSIRVSLVSFVPALKQRIAVQPGMQSLLYINMASILSSIELVYAAPGQGALMSDDWKWTLKASSSTRPVLRALPGAVSVSDRETRQRSRGGLFSDTRALVNVSAGDYSGSFGSSSASDLGTAFALATSLLGRNQLQVSGNLGYAARSGVPAASFRTSFSRQGFGPELTLTMRQVYLPARAGAALALGPQEGAPALRSMSIAAADRLQIGDRLEFDYGASLDSVSFLDRLNYFSPFARLAYDLGENGALQFAYSSGAPPAQLLKSSAAEGGARAGLDAPGGEELTGDLAALAVAARVSLRDGRAAVQRTQAFEFGYEKRFGAASVDLTGYREIVGNGALTMFGPPGALPPGDLLPELSSRGSVVNIGSYQRYGYAASVTQPVCGKLELGASFGRAGAFTAADAPLSSPSAQELRSKIHISQRFWASARASATLPGSGARIAASYQWLDSNAVLPAHLYLTQRAYPEGGLNIYVRQPIPSFPGMPGRLEATAELRNLLAEGYLPVSTGDGRRLLLIQSPRGLRGGLSFIF